MIRRENAAVTVTDSRPAPAMLGEGAKHTRRGTGHPEAAEPACGPRARAGVGPVHFRTGSPVPVRGRPQDGGSEGRHSAPHTSLAGVATCRIPSTTPTAQGLGFQVGEKSPWEQNGNCEAKSGCSAQCGETAFNGEMGHTV